MIKNYLKILIISSLLFCISCGKESTQSGVVALEKGSGRLLLNNSQEVLSYLEQFEKADINERIELSSSAPEETYLLVIEDIEKGDNPNVESIDITSWLSNEQKERVRKSNGCMSVKFYDSTFIPASQDSEPRFILGDISLQDIPC